MALKKIQDGIRFKISLQKSIERKNLLQKSLFSQCYRLQARLKNWNASFPILKICNLSKTQNFQNSLKIWVYIIEIYVQRNSCYNWHKEAPKKIGWNRRTHGSGSGNSWMFSQIFTRKCFLEASCNFIPSWIIEKKKFQGSEIFWIFDFLEHIFKKCALLI
jgi:hypothetical protein